MKNIMKTAIILATMATLSMTTAMAHNHTQPKPKKQQTVKKQPTKKAQKQMKKQPVKKQAQQRPSH